MLSDAQSLHLAAYSENESRQKDAESCTARGTHVWVLINHPFPATALMRRILSLDECLIILATHDRSRHYEVLTFDDGYRDNLSVASDPRAEQRAIYIPADAPARSMQSWRLV